MGTALAIAHARAGVPVTLLGTAFDEAAIDACAAGRAHPALGMPLPEGITCRHHDEFEAVVAEAERLVVGVSSGGLADVVGEAAPRLPAGSTWVLATKGWDGATLRTPSEVVADAHGGRVVVLAGPALAPELAGGAPMAMVSASTDAGAAEAVAEVLSAAGVSMTVTDDVVGAETGAAYKNVTAIAVGIPEGLRERLPERVYVHDFANARAAMFALGLGDMARLAEARGGRSETILGLAGVGDLYVTCLGGRNGRFGRLVGEGQTPDQALASIGSTVEGVENTSAALALGESLGVELVAARLVDSVLSGSASPEEAITTALG